MNEKRSKGCGNKFGFFLFAAVLVGLSGNLIAEVRHGAEVEARKKDRNVVKGELIAVKSNSIVVLNSTGADVPLNISDISGIHIRKGSQVEGGLIAGILLGGAAGALFGARVERGIDWASGNKPHEWGFEKDLVCALAGGALGAILGSQIKASENIQIQGKTPEQLKAALEKLRSKARVPNFQ